MTETELEALLKDKYVIADCDGCVVSIWPKWVERALEIPSFKAKWMAKYGEDYDIKDCLFNSVRTPSLKQWLGLTDEEYLEHSRCYELDEHFYDDLELTKLGKLLQKHSFGKICFVSHGREWSKSKESKIRFLEKQYEELGSAIVIVPFPEPKSEAMTRFSFRDGTYGSDADFLIEDSAPVLEDVHSRFPNIKLIVPDYGYNRTFTDCIRLQQELCLG